MTTRKDPPYLKNIASYLKDIPDNFLTKDEQLHYGRLYREGTPHQKKEAMEKLVSSSLYFVINIAKNMGYTGMEIEDLIQEGNIGLMKAVERYDYTKGLAFTTYAIWWVRQSILKATKDKATNVRLPSHIYDLERKIHSQEKKFERKGIPLDINTLAKSLGKKVEQIQQHKVHVNMKHTQPLDEKAFTSPLKMLDPNTKNNTVFEDIAHQEISQFIRKLFFKRVLDERESTIICLRYGFSDLLSKEDLIKYKQYTQKATKTHSHSRKKIGLTLEEISKIVGLSKERIRQLERHSIEKLQTYRRENARLFIDLL